MAETYGETWKKEAQLEENISEQEHVGKCGKHFSIENTLGIHARMLLLEKQ